MSMYESVCEEVCMRINVYECQRENVCVCERELCMNVCM